MSRCYQLYQSLELGLFKDNTSKDNVRKSQIIMWNGPMLVKAAGPVLFQGMMSDVLVCGEDEGASGEQGA